MLAALQISIPIHGGIMPNQAILVCLTVLFALAGRSLSGNVAVDPDSLRNVSELISTKGYPVEEYEVITNDGYVIGIQRIPRGKNESPDAALTNKTTILLQHGMLGSSADFVLNFPNQSLGFLLADAGYDVWLGNARGNIYTSHINLSRDDRRFWDFSIDELASEDLPSIIDTILKITGKEKLQYVGWSQGALQMFAMLSEKPEYNKKQNRSLALELDLQINFEVSQNFSSCKTNFGYLQISLISVIGPVAYLGHVRAPLRLLVPFADLIADSLKLVGKGEVLVPTPALQKIINDLCGSKLGENICTAVTFLITGIDSKQTNKSRMAVYYNHNPSGSSVNDILHLAQLIRCNCFRKFDYGIIKNLAKYAKSKPPEYVLSRVEVPVAIYWSKGDWFAVEEDVARLREELPKVVEYYQVPDEQFTHYDFSWGINAEPILFRQMISVMAKYQT